MAADLVAADLSHAAGELYRHDVHAGRADEITDEGVLRPLEQFLGRTDLHDLAVIHDNDLLGESQGFGLVVRDIDHGIAEALVQLLQLRAQHPLHVGIDNRQRLIEQDGIDVGSNEATAQRYLLLLIGGETARLLFGPAGEIDHFQRFAHLAVNLRFGHTAIAQGKGKIVVDGHGVVDDRELEYLRDIAFLGGKVRYILAVEEQLTVRRMDQP